MLSDDSVRWQTSVALDFFLRLTWLVGEEVGVFVGIYMLVGSCMFEISTPVATAIPITNKVHFISDIKLFR